MFLRSWVIHPWVYGTPWGTGCIGIIGGLYNLGRKQLSDAIREAKREDATPRRKGDPALCPIPGYGGRAFFVVGWLPTQRLAGPRAPAAMVSLGATISACCRQALPVGPCRADTPHTARGFLAMIVRPGLVSLSRGVAAALSGEFATSPLLFWLGDELCGTAPARSETGSRTAKRPRPNRSESCNRKILLNISFSIR